jgi:hypothetical protein
MNQAFPGQTLDPLHPSNTEYNSFVGGQTWGSLETAIGVRAMFGTSGTLTKLSIWLTSHTLGTFTFTLLKNGSPTGLSVALAYPVSSGSVEADVAVSPGDYLSVQCAPVGGGSSTKAAWLTEFTSDASDELAAPAVNGGGVGGTPQYWALIGCGGEIALDINTSQQVMPIAGTIRGIYAKMVAAPGVGSTRTFTLMKNGLATALAATISGTDTTATSATEVSFADGDVLNIRQTNTGANTNILAFTSCTIVPTTIGQTVYSGGEATLVNSGTRVSGFVDDRIVPAVGGGQQPMIACTLKTMRIWLSSAPGAGNSWKFTVQLNGSPTAMEITVSGTDTTGVITTDVAVADGDLLNVSVLPASSPGVPVRATWGVRADVAVTLSTVLEMAFGQSIFTTTPTWTDVSSYFMDQYIKRGRQHQLDRCEAGEAVLILNNAAGDWWRNNAAGTFYPNVKPLTLVRISRPYNGISYPLFYGVVEGFEPKWLEKTGGFNPIVTVSCVDIFKSFAKYRIIDANPLLTENGNVGDAHVHVASTYGLVEGQNIRIYDDNGSENNTVQQVSPSLNLITLGSLLTGAYLTANGAAVKKFPAVLSGARFQDIVLEVGWPTALCSIDTGQVLLIEISPGVGGTNALEALFKTVESENGNMFVSVSGILTFHDSIARTKSPYNTSQATFRDDGTNSKYVLPDLVDDDEFTYNEADIFGDGIEGQVLIDGALQLTQLPRAIVRRDSLIYHEYDANTQAFELVQRYKQSSLRVKSLLIKPDASAADLYPKVLGYDLSTRITLVLNSTRNPAGINQAYHIEGITQRWNASTNLWETFWELWEVNKFQQFPLTHSGYAQRDSGIDYADLHDDANATSVNNDGASLVPAEIAVGQWIIHSGGSWLSGTMWRAYLEFNTSALLAGDTIAEAYIIFKTQAEHIDNAWDLILVSNGGVDSPLVLADYGTLKNQTTKLADDLAIDGLVGWKTLVLNSTGIAAINKGGITRFALRSERDIDNVDPGATSLEFALISGFVAFDAKYTPRLIVRFS